MKGSFRVMAGTVFLILLGAAAYTGEAAPTGGESDGSISPISRKSAENLLDKKEQKLKVAEAQKAKEEDKLKDKEKQAKIEKLQAKTGRTTRSWQVLNR